MTSIVFSPSIGPVSINVFLGEGHYSDLEITKNPIETGAEVNDHAYIKPKEVNIEFATDSAAATYEALVAFQESRVPFQLVTGLKVYSNMLIETLNPSRDKDTNDILKGTATLREIKIASTATSSKGVSSSSEASPGGSNSRRAVAPTSSNVDTTDATVANKASGTVVRGDSRVTSVPASQNQSILSRAF